MLKDAQNVGEEKFPLSDHTIERITDGMYGVINEPGGTGGQLKLTGIELSGKSGTAQVIGYGTRAKLSKQKKFEDNAWFVGYAPKRNPEIVVAVLVQESGQHGGEAAGPVVRDIVKAYYDKKNHKVSGTITADEHPAAPAAGTAVVTPAVALKPTWRPRKLIPRTPTRILNEGRSRHTRLRLVAASHPRRHLRLGVVKSIPPPMLVIWSECIQNRSNG
jgi:membrane peptidoglycan carboxypeptidase